MDDEPDTGELDDASAQETELVRLQRAILGELATIRFRLGTLVLFLVVLPVVAAVVVLFAVHQ